MGKINMGRVILGGIVAGIVYDILDYPVNGIWLAPRWNNDLAALGHAAINGHQIVSFNIVNIIGGIAFLWLYAAIRPRYGAGPRTAIHAAVWFWIICAVIPNMAFMWIPHLFSHHLMVYTTAAALVETIIAGLAGAALYKEE
jgi:hypothetical protein